ncbi:MAG: DUF3299 domain-containing protein [Acidobacteriota bacterium]
MPQPHSFPRRSARRQLCALTLFCLLLCAGCGGEEGPSGLPRADWRVLNGLDIVTGSVAPELEPLLGPEVRLPGFIVPFEDSLTAASTFLLVPNFGACVHLPPPAANQMVLVEMNEGRNVAVDLWSPDPVWIVGHLRVTESDSPWGAVGFSMRASATVPFAEGLGKNEKW